MLLYQPFVDCLMDFQDTELAHAFKMRKQTTWPFYIFSLYQGRHLMLFTLNSLSCLVEPASLFDQKQQHTLS